MNVMHRIADRSSGISLGRATLAHVIAVQTGAVVICIAIMVYGEGLRAAPEGIAMWLFGQMVILPFMIVSLPVALLIRTALGFARWPARAVAVGAGGLIGAALAAVAVLAGDDLSTGLRLVTWCSFGVCGGIVGGWTWRFIERPRAFEPSA